MEGHATAFFHLSMAVVRIRKELLEHLGGDSQQLSTNHFADRPIPAGGRDREQHGGHGDRDIGAHEENQSRSAGARGASDYLRDVAGSWDAHSDYGHVGGYRPIHLHLSVATLQYLRREL